MRVSDIIKVLDENVLVVIFQSHKVWQCALGEGWDWGCDFYSPMYDDAVFEEPGEECENCNHSGEEIMNSDEYVGRAKNVPIRLSEKRVKTITHRTIKVPYSKNGKKRHDMLLLGVEIE